MRASHVGAVLLGFSLVGAGALTFSTPLASASSFGGGAFAGGGGTSAPVTLNGDTDYLPRSIIAQAPSGLYAFKVAQNGAKVKFGTYSNETDECYASTTDDIVKCGTFEFAQINTSTLNTRAADGSNLSLTAFGSGAVKVTPSLLLTPQGSTPTCDSGAQGKVHTLSSDGRAYHCDGTTTQRLAYVLSTTSTIDFASMSTHTMDSKTMTVAGATTADAVFCTPVSGGAMGGAVMSPTVTASNTVTIVASNDTDGTVDPPSMSIKCVVVR